MKLYAYHLQRENETGASMHLALEKQNGITKLNNGFGVLFPKCVFDGTALDGSSRGLRYPWVFRMENGFGVVALRCAFNQDGIAQKNDGVVFFTSKNLIAYEEQSLISLPEAEKATDIACVVADGTYCLILQVDGQWQSWQTTDFCNFTSCADTCQPPMREDSTVWDAVPACVLDVTETEANVLCKRFVPPMMPHDAARFPFPLMTPRGDPMAIRWEDGYLFMATDDEHGQRALKIRRVDKLEDIPTAEEHLLLPANDEGDYSGCLWAPELHRVNGRLCIFFAAGMPHWYTVQSRVMMLEGEDPCDASCWSAPKRIVRKDGSPLYEEGITLDMTVIPTKKGSYVVWSQREILLDPVRCGTADLMIARLDEQEPWKLLSDPVVLSRPEYGWERIHSAVNEGPFLLRRNETLYLTYAAALIDDTYCVGMLTAKDGDELLDPACWTKSNYPVFHRFSNDKMIGAGHNAFVQDARGRDLMLIHSLSRENYLHDHADIRRYPCIREVVWDDTEYPHFDAVE